MNRLIIPSLHFDVLRRLDCEQLQAELDRADVLPAADVPDDVVTMHARVLYVDETTGERRGVTLVYPHEADVSRGRISVLAPVGLALLGLFAGDTIEWTFPHGPSRRLRVLQVTRSGPRHVEDAARHDEWLVDEAIRDSFPASDPASSTQPGSIVNQRYARNAGEAPDAG